MEEAAHEMHAITLSIAAEILKTYVDAQIRKVTDLITTVIKEDTSRQQTVEFD